MASVPIRLGLKHVSGHNNALGAKVILSRTAAPFDIRVAFITSKTLRVVEDRWPKPKPWPYKEKGYSNIRAWFEGTVKRFDENTKLITVEGPPAIGKSSFAKALADELEMQYLPMVTTDYQHINHYGFDFRTLDPILPRGAKTVSEIDYIKDPNGYNCPVLPFSLFRLKYAQYIDALAHLFNTGDGVVIERSFWTDLAFAEALNKVGYMTKNELQAYHKMRTNVVTEHQHWHLEDPLRPHLAIYLDASVDTVLKNFQKRGLGEEKTYHAEFLSALEDHYKRKSIVEMEKHAEVLVYDWNEPGNVETVVEDIERIDFDKYGCRDEKQKDWRFKEDWDYCEHRWQYTQNKQSLLMSADVTMFDCPRLYMDGQENQDSERIYYESPGNKHGLGFNPDLGDKIIFKMEPRGYVPLPEVVTKMLLEKVKPAA